MKTRLVHKHSEKCQQLCAANPELARFKWWANGEIEKDNAGGWGNGGYNQWIVLLCNISTKCPGKLLVSIDSVVEAVTAQEVEP